MADKKGLYLLAGFQSPRVGEITADSIPDLDGWGWDDYWSCDDWINWHKAMKQKYGLEFANRKFSEEFNKRSSFGHEFMCMNTAPFYSYFTGQGIDGNFFSDVVVGAQDVISAGAGAASGAAKGAGGAIENVAKVAKWLLPVALMLGVGGLTYYGYKKYLK